MLISYLSLADNSETNLLSPNFDSTNTSFKENYLESNFNKYINLYQLKLNASVAIPTSFGEFTIQQTYNGQFLKLAELSSRDDENWSLGFKTPLTNFANLLVKQNFILSSDSRNIGINQLSRLNGTIGMEIADQEFYSISALTGLESNKLLGIQSMGNIFGLNANLNDYKIENITSNANFSANWLSLSMNRMEKDISGNLVIGGNFLDESYLRTSLVYKYIQNNLFSFFSTNDLPLIETRQGRNIVPSIFVSYNIVEPLSVVLDFTFNSNNIRREFKESIEILDYSYFRRNIDQTDLFLNVGLNFDWKLLTNNISFAYWSRTETNTLELINKSYTKDITKFQNIENQRDYSTNKYNLLNQTVLKFNQNTNLSVIYNVYLLRYDTPSKFNYDDRDEFNSIIRLNLNHRFSDYTQTEIVFENIQNHLVYLFSQRSIMNNWNKIYRLSPTIRYQNDYLQLNPQFEVLANYTVYDYSEKSASTKNISLRYLSYRDSISLNLGLDFEMNSQVKYQLSERSILNWHEFSEYPQIRINEFYIKSLLIRKYEYTNIGIGISFFDYIQTRIVENLLDYDLTSISPQVAILFKWKDWQMQLDGWYEFRYQNKRKINDNANMNFTVKMLF